MENQVLYMMCPHCGKGWFGKIKHEDKNQVIIEGITDTDVTKEITCLNCGKKYTPIKTSCKMWDFVAQALTTVKGS